MNILDIQLNDKDKAYINLLEMHLRGFNALLHDMGGTQIDGPFASRELACAFTRIEEGYYSAREHVFRAAAKRNAVQ